MCRKDPSQKGKYIKIILALLQSISTAVVYECAVTLVSLSQAPTAIRCAADTWSAGRACRLVPDSCHALLHRVRRALRRGSGGAFNTHCSLAAVVHVPVLMGCRPRLPSCCRQMADAMQTGAGHPLELAQDMFIKLSLCCVAVR